jgi:hypothetical protein
MAYTSEIRRKKDMSIWRTILKRSGLALMAAVVALCWTETGHAVAPCLIERGQDPLDVLNSTVRHNVWIVLDTSGSMSDIVPNSGNQTKIQIAKATLTEVINELVDGSGKPLVNWGFVKFGKNSGSSTASCTNQFSNGCVGLDLNGLINPPLCSDPSNTTSVKNAINAVSASGNTPDGIAMDQISDKIVTNGFVANLLPNQRNFVILVTDGDDTCECGDKSKNTTGKLINGLWTPTVSPPFASGVTVPRQLRGGIADGSYNTNIDVSGNNTETTANLQAANAGSKGRLLYDRLNPSAADKATGAKGGAFVIGLGLSGNSPARANHMAWEASGAYYGNAKANHALFANDKVGLKNALRDAFAKIGVPSSTVTLGSPVVGSVREVIPGFTDTSVLAADHIGDVGPSTVDPDDIRKARSVRGNHQDNVLFQSSVDVPGFFGHFTAYNIYNVTDPTKPRTARQADFTKVWDAGLQLQKLDPTARTIYFNKRGQTTLLPFDTSNVSAADLGVAKGYLSSIDGVGALSATDARDIVVSVMRGYRLSKDSVTNTIYNSSGKLNFSTLDKSGNNTWKLYDSVAAPAVVGPPERSPDFDPPQSHANEYGVGGTQVGDGFFWDHFNRQTMVYLPTNGGMLHAFDGQTGNEVFAYIPDDVMGLDPAEVPGNRDTLADFVEQLVAENNGIQNHKYYLAGSPSVRDAFLRSDHGGDDNWHTVLAFGRGRGGRFLSVLDISDPTAPKLRFNVGNREGISDGLLDGLGETWSTPVMGNVATNNPSSSADRVDQWLAFAGGGYGCNNAFNEGQYLFGIRVEDGSVYYRGQVANNSKATVTYNAVVAQPVLFNPHESDTADSKDYVSRAYVGDIQGNVWKLVTTDLDPTKWSLKKFAELGLDQPISAPVALLKDVNNQQVFVMVGTGGDSRVSSTVATFKFATLIDADKDGVNTTQYPLGTPAFWSKDLGTSQRVYIAPVTIGQVGDATPALVFFAASQPAFDVKVCTGKFYSSLYALGIMSGQAEVDLNGGGNDESVDLGEGKVTGLYARSGNLYVSESGGIGTSGTLSVYGDGDFSDDIQSGGSGVTIQVLVDSFRISPF